MSSFVSNQTPTATAAAKKPVPVVKTPALAAKKPALAAKKPALAAKKPALAAKKPGTAAKKPVVRKTVQQKLDASYKTAKMIAKKIVNNVDNDAKLDMYKWFKQVEHGDCTGKRPGMFNVKARAKYDAWASCKGTAKQLAMQKYVETVCALSQK